MTKKIITYILLALAAILVAMFMGAQVAAAFQPKEQKALQEIQEIKEEMGRVKQDADQRRLDMTKADNQIKKLEQEKAVHAVEINKRQTQYDNLSKRLQVQLNIINEAISFQ